MATPTLRTFPSPGSLADALAALLQAAFAGVATGRDPFGVVVPGGATPLEAYRRIADEPGPVAPGFRLLLSDDRLVPADSPRSNYGRSLPMIRALGLPAGRFLRPQGLLPAAEAVRRFDDDVGKLLPKASLPLAVLGLGADGHTASLFTPEDIARGSGRWAVGVDRPDGLEGVSLTPRAFALAERIVFIASGSSKRDAVARLLSRPESLVAGLAVAQSPAVEVWADAAAIGSDPIRPI
jgi:6-phosphogluconolactonase